ncbi:MAG: DUF2339 domain-containing protein [Leptospiraceae bacterium]|nr:DUF2339 domain-containing protein [Leptospiraceae bacterium]
MATKKELKEVQDKILFLETELTSLKEKVKLLSNEKTVPVKQDVVIASAETISVPPEKNKLFQKFNFEQLFGANLIGKTGFVAIILAFIWFLDFAFSNYWINESGRIFIGIFSAFAIIFGGLYFAKKNSELIPAPMIGTGFSILYLSVFAAFRFYGLINSIETFVMLSLIALILAILSNVSKSEVLYGFSFLGSILSPLLLSTGENSYRFFFTYLFFVNILFLWISKQNPWKITPFIVLITNLVLYNVWQFNKIAVSQFMFPFVYLMSLIGIFLYRELFLMIAKRNLLHASSIVLLVILILTSSSDLGYLFYQFYPSFQAHILLVIASILFFVLSKVQVPNFQEKERLLSILSFLGLGLVVLALTIQFEGKQITISFIVLATLVSVFGVSRSVGLVIFSLFIWFLALISLFFNDSSSIATGIFILNTRFLLYAFASIGLFLTYYIGKEKKIFPQIQWFVFTGIAVLIIGTLVDTHYSITDRYYRNLGYSYVLAFYAIVLLVPGFLYSHASLRKGGIVVILLLIAKLYLYDIWTMSIIVKIIAGFSLGTGLVLTSIFYEKFKNKILGD